MSAGTFTLATAPLLPWPAVGVVPVVDDRARLVGAIDARGAQREASVPEQSTIGEALATLARRRARRAVVVTADGTVVGMVEDLALMHALKDGAAKSAKK